MNNRIKPFSLLTLLLIGANLSACNNDSMGLSSEPSPAVITPFTYATTATRVFETRVLDADLQALSGVSISLYSSSPVDTLTGKWRDGVNPLLRGVSDDGGSLTMTVNLPLTVDSVFLTLAATGYAQPLIVPLSKGAREVVTFAPVGATASKSKTLSSNDPFDLNRYNPQMLFGNVYQLGDFSNGLGVPLYKNSSPMAVPNSVRTKIYECLPAGESAELLHPDYFDLSQKTDVDVIEDGEIFVDFLSEGAGYRSAMGYYTYPTGNPAKSIAEIERQFVIFPNASFLNSNGGLVEGDRVQLLYWDKATDSYSNIFPAGISIGWFLLVDAFRGNKLTSSAQQLYSEPSFNPSGYMQSLTLNDSQNEMVYICFEDIAQAYGGDKDFNDVIFNVTSNPQNILDKDNLDPIKEPIDSDNDGVYDNSDEYPNDPDLAFNSYYPAKGVYGTLAYEDLWPAKGDYDFNDLVVDVNVHSVLNASNKIVYMHPTFVLRASGASFHNGFAVNLGCKSGAVASVSGARLNSSLFTINGAGIESGPTTAIVPIFTNAYELFGFPTNANTDPSVPSVDEVIIPIRIDFTEPIDPSELKPAPFDPFMVVAADRSLEVHLPNNPPTSLANSSLLATQVDASKPHRGIYYLSEGGMPWAISLPERFAYPSEKNDISSAHLHFMDWAISSGAQYNDWYQDKSSYRDNSKIY